jgi:hypothetical protein
MGLLLIGTITQGAVQRRGNRNGLGKQNQIKKPRKVTGNGTRGSLRLIAIAWCVCDGILDRLSVQRSRDCIENGLKERNETGIVLCR